MSLPAGASITTVRGKRFPRAAATTNNTSKIPAVPAAAAVPPPTSSSAALAGIVDAVSVAGPSTSAILSSTHTPAAHPSSNTSTTPSTAISSAVSFESTSSSARPNSLTTPAQQSATANSSSAPDSVATTSTSTPSVSASSSQSIIQPIAATSHIQPATAVADTKPISSFESPPITLSASVTTTQTISTISSVPGLTTSPSVIPPTVVAGDSPAGSSAGIAANSPPSSRSVVGAVMGGVVGGLALVGILLFFWWRYHRKRGRRHSLLTPLNTHFNDRYQSDKYEIDGSSLGPTQRGTRLRAQAEGICYRAHMSIGNFGVAIKAKLATRENTPTVNMDRGNSQFLEPSPPHSCSGSASSVGAVDVGINRERFRERWNRFTQKVVFNWRLHTGTWKRTDRSATTGIMTKKEPYQGQISPQFLNPQAANDRQLRLGSFGHRRSLSTPWLDFGTAYPTAQPTIPGLTKLPVTLTTNSSQAAVDPARLSGPKSISSNYIANVQRSRGLSQPTPGGSVFGSRPLGYSTTNVNSPPRYPSTNTAAQSGSQYSSVIRNSLDSSRDTIISAFSASGRKAKCLSDPFDLERPELLRPAMPVTPDNQLNDMGFLAFPRMSIRAGAQGRLQPHIESIHTGGIRIVSATDSLASSKYSSGTSAILHEWGGAEPDLGSFAWERGSPLSPHNGTVANGGDLATEATEGVVGRAL